MIQHIVGSILYEVELNQFFIALGQIPIVPTAAYSEIWKIVFFAYPVERLILIVTSVIVATPIITIIVRNHFLSFGKQEKPKVSNSREPSAPTNA